MSVLTSTNEEGLVRMMEELPKGSWLRLTPSSAASLVEVIEHTVDGKKIWRASMMAIDMHSEVWTGNAGLARNYR